MKKILSLLAVSATLSLFAGETPLWRNNTDREFLPKKSPFESRSKSKSGLPGFDHSNLVIKMNLTQIAFKNLSFQAEFAFHPKLSVALGYSKLSFG